MQRPLPRRPATTCLVGIEPGEGAHLPFAFADALQARLHQIERIETAVTDQPRGLGGSQLGGILHG